MPRSMTVLAKSTASSTERISSSRRQSKMNHPAKALAVRPIDVAMVPKIHAVAVNATEMAEANKEIKVFITAKLASIQAEKNGITEAFFVAEQNGWKTDALATTEKRLI